MNNIKEFNKNPISQRDFWRTTGPVCAALVLLTIVIITWERPGIVEFRGDPKKKLKEFTKKTMDDLKNQWRKYRPPRNSTSVVAAGDSSVTPNALRESSIANTTEGPVTKLSSAIKKAVGTIAIPKWRGRGSWELDKTPNHQVLSDV